MNNDNQDDVAKLLPNLWFNKNPFSLQKVSLMGKIFTAHVPQGEKRLDGFRLDEVMVLEIFAGTARLSRAMRCGDECNGH